MSLPAFDPAQQKLIATLLFQTTGGSSELLSEPMKEGGPEDVYVKISSIHGLGLFARRTFATGETILVRDERPVTAEQPLDPAKGEFEYHCERVEGGRLVYLGYPARHINHSCDPNAFLRRRDGLTYLIALKPIRPNDEIVRHYAVNLSDGGQFVCGCGSQRCIGVLPGDFFSLPSDVQLELSPLLSTSFILEHRDRYRAMLRAAGLSEEDVS